jgi:hypothetical protein
MQEHLVKILRSLLPSDVTMRTNYSHPSLLYSNTNASMQFDVYIPSLAIAIEYQGQQHYYEHYLWGALDLQKKKDEEKRQACKKNGITLIEIPFWWDGRSNSLEATLHKYCPGVFTSDPNNMCEMKPISEKFPEGTIIDCLKLSNAFK